MNQDRRRNHPFRLPSFILHPSSFILPKRRVMIRHSLFVATIGEGVFASADHGESFRRACDGMPFVECYVRALAVDPADPATLYLGNVTGVWVSRDGAKSWIPLLLLDGHAVWSLEV